MSDLIRVIDLEVYAHIGVPEAERAQAQRLLISLEMVCDGFAHAASTDNIAWTINYYEVTQYVKVLVARRARRLLETLAEDLAFELQKNFPIKHITIEIKKFILPDAQYVSVKIDREKIR